MATITAEGYKKIRDGITIRGQVPWDNDSESNHQYMIGCKKAYLAKNFYTNRVLWFLTILVALMIGGISASLLAGGITGVCIMVAAVAIIRLFNGITKSELESYEGYLSDIQTHPRYERYHEYLRLSETFQALHPVIRAEESQRLLLEASDEATVNTTKHSRDIEAVLSRMLQISHEFHLETAAGTEVDIEQIEASLDVEAWMRRATDENVALKEFEDRITATS